MEEESELEVLKFRNPPKKFARCQVVEIYTETLLDRENSTCGKFVPGKKFVYCKRHGWLTPLEHEWEIMNPGKLWKFVDRYLLSVIIIVFFGAVLLIALKNGW